MSELLKEELEGRAAPRADGHSPLVAEEMRLLCGRPLGEILKVSAGLTQERLEEALSLQTEKGGRIGEVLVGLKYVTEEEVAKALGIQFDIPFVGRIGVENVDQELLKMVPINFAKQTRILPLGLDGDLVALAIADPLDTTTLDHARLAHELEEPKDLLDTDDEAPIIRLVNSLLFRAAKERSSDIHIEPMERELIVRFRIDGVLQEIIKPPKRYQNSIVSRVKVMGQLNIAEKRLPQDGRIRIKLAGRDIDIRLSTIPTAHGERIVMRLLDKTATLLDLAEIGMNADTLKQIDGIIHRSHGIILVTGPTGSGKTTTLYGALSRINTIDLNILTVEDPVEYQLKGIGQMAINPKIGLTFATGLRSFLRQDPDVIMVGEIRDRETAEIAIQASLNGHLV